MSGFLDRRNSRTVQYGTGAKPLDPNQNIVLRISPDYAHTYSGQAGFLTAANLIGRMTHILGIDVPKDVRLLSPLPWAGCLLHEVVLEQLNAATPEDKGGRHTQHAARSEDYVLSFGPSRIQGAATVHGCGWNAYCGTGDSPIASCDDLNPLGAAFAAILAAGHMMNKCCESLPSDYLCNALEWRPEAAPADAPKLDLDTHLGDIWTVGTGSVGTAILYFLTLFTRNFDASLIDMDRVEIENLDRSPIFTADDCGLYKVEATRNYLRGVGIDNVRIEACSLGKSELGTSRQEGTPDLIIAAANEDHVRYWIESNMPPIQIYGTTGRSWQASVVRHIPFVDTCSLCLFPDDTRPTAACATGTPSHESEKKIDVALPFLSFAAGLMGASEILKLGLQGFPFVQANITQVSFRCDEKGKLHSKPLTAKPNCLCRRDRNKTIHERMISGTKYAGLSESCLPPKP